MEKKISLEAYSRSAGQEICLPVTQPVALLPHMCQPTTAPYPEPLQFNALFLEPF
jgi:hypothetical protein